MQIRHALDLRQKRLLALTPDLQRAIAMLQMTTTELSALLLRMADENPFLQASTPALPVSRGSATTGFEPDDLPASASGTGLCLFDHVQQQMGLCGVTRSETPLALLLTDALTPAGWLDRPLAEIAATQGLPLSRLEQVLDKLQRMEPTGLFARDLTDCLRLQLAEAGFLDGAAEQVLAHLPLLETGGAGALAAAAGLPRAAVDAVLQRLRGLDPRPGLAFDTAHVPAALPELTATRRADGGWQVQLERSVLPTIRLDEQLMHQLGPDGGSPELRASFGTARWLVAAIARRQQSVLRIGAAAVQHQAAFLDSGPDGLRPLSQRSLAVELDLSESTVSRVVNSVFIQTPRGTFALKRLFLQPVGGSEAGEGVSPTWLCASIRDQIRAESPKSPLSDAAIAARFEQRGLKIARRTVAKYRAQMGIPATSERRQTQSCV